MYFRTVFCVQLLSDWGAWGNLDVHENLRAPRCHCCRFSAEGNRRIASWRWNGHIVTVRIKQISGFDKFSPFRRSICYFTQCSHVAILTRGGRKHSSTPYRCVFVVNASSWTWTWTLKSTHCRWLHTRSSIRLRFEGAFSFIKTFGFQFQVSS